MGVIEKQASKSTVYIYLGILIGFLNTLLFPHFLSADKKGILDAITSASFLLTSIFTLGLPLLTLRHFPKFRNSDKNNYGFLGFSMLITLIGVIIGLGFIKLIFNEVNLVTSIPINRFHNHTFILFKKLLYFINII